MSHEAPEPRPHKCNMLRIAAWAMVLYTLLLTGPRLHEIWKALGAGDVSGVLGILRVAGVLTFVGGEMALAFLLVLVVGLLERVDRGAMLCAWRRGCLAKATAEREGPRLTLFAPLAIAGGLQLFWHVSMIVARTGVAPLNMGNVQSAAYGAVALLLAFALEELERLFSRLRNAARALQRDSGDGRAVPGERDKRRVWLAHFLAVAVTLSLAMWPVSQFMIVSWSSAQGFPTQFVDEYFICGMLVYSALMVAAGYVLCRFTWIWQSVLREWRRVVRPGSGSGSGRRGERLFIAFGVVLGAIALVVGISVPILSGSFAGGALSNVSVFLARGFLLLWLVVLKGEITAWARSVDTLRPDSTNTGREGGATGGLARLTLGLALLVLSYAAVDTVFRAICFRGMLYGAPFMAAFALVAQTLHTCLFTVLPALWFVLVSLDLDRAASSLEAAAETPPAAHGIHSRAIS